MNNDKNIVTNDGAASNVWTPEKLAGLPWPRVRVRVQHEDGEVSIRCPYCGRTHRHSGHPIPGPRASHCDSNGGEYVIVAKGGAR